MKNTTFLLNVVSPIPQFSDSYCIKLINLTRLIIDYLH